MAAATDATGAGAVVLTAVYVAKLRLKMRLRSSQLGAAAVLAAGDNPAQSTPLLTPSNGCATAFDDGFQPPRCPHLSRMLPQPALRSDRLCPGNGRQLVVIPEAVDDSLAREAFAFSSKYAGSWGTYLELNGLEPDGSPRLRASSGSDGEPDVTALALRLVKSLLRRGAGSLLLPDLDRLHGFSLWSVQGGVGQMTEYHVDYAEIYRRETGIIRPPLHAITLQLSPVDPEDIEGGTFGAHVGGIEHYAQHGYKCRLAPPQGGYPTPDWCTDAGWRHAPYAFNQATVSAGDLPHASSRVVKWPVHIPRVVIGINTFGPEEGPVEARLPLHSAAFRRALKLQRLEAVLARLPQEQLSRILGRGRGGGATAAGKAVASDAARGCSYDRESSGA